MTRSRTAWRLSSSSSNDSVTCRIRESASGHVTVTVVENGRRLDRVVFRGSHHQALHQAWRKAVVFHEKYRRTDAPQPSPEQRQRHLRSETALPAELLSSIRRLERCRGDVLRALESRDLRGDHFGSAVRRFRASWEVLDLEHHFLTGRPLTVAHYRKRLRKVFRRVAPLASESR